MDKPPIDKEFSFIRSKMALSGDLDRVVGKLGSVMIQHGAESHVW
jgi:hypothetical protein